MTDKEIIAAFAAFTHPDENRTLSQLAFSGTAVYATDGRLAIDGRLSEAQPEKIPENYPIKSLLEILDGPRAVREWYVLKSVEFEHFDGQFAEACKQERSEQLCNYRSRYTEETCPCCNETVYWDAWEGKLVKEREESSAFDVRDVVKPTLICFANGLSVLINFCYLHLLVSSFGRDLRLAIGKCQDEKNPMLYMKTEDGRFYGVLMPMRSHDGAFDTDYRLHAESVI